MERRKKYACVITTMGNCKEVKPLFPSSFEQWLKTATGGKDDSFSLTSAGVTGRDIGENFYNLHLW